MTWGVYFLVLWPKMIIHDETGFKAWGYTAFDWSTHLSYAHVFTYQPISEWFTHHPLFYNISFSYHFLADAISGVLIRIGVPLFHAFFIPSVITSLFLLTMLFIFYYGVLRSSKQSIVALTIFLAGGGLGFFWFFKSILNKTLNYNSDTLYTELVDHGINWLNVVISELIPQRAFLLGIPITLFILFILWHWIKTKFESVTWLPLVLLGFIAALLLLAHTASYVVLVITSIIFTIYYWRYWKKWLVFGTAAALTSLPLFFYFYKLPIEGEVTHKFFVWNPEVLISYSSIDSFFAYWFFNWGAFFLIALVIIFKKEFLKNPFVISALTLFLLSNLIQFQPNPWDNRKYLVWSYLFFAIPITQYLTNLWRKKALGKLTVIILFFTLTISGFLDLGSLLTINPKHNNAIFTNQDVILAKKFREVSNPESIVLTSEKNNHWATTLSGRRILLGSNFALWSYGISFENIKTDIQSIYAGDNSAQDLLKKYNVSYIIIGPLEHEEYDINEAFFQTYFPIVINQNNTAVYKVH
jgi:hypothetical protein